MKKTSVGLIFIISIVSSTFCSKSFDKDSPVVKKYAFPDETKLVKTDGYDRLAFSPFCNDVIWLMDANKETYEFDIESGKFKSLKPFLEEFSSGSKFVKDSIDDNVVWIYSFHKGIVKYDKSTGTKTVFSIRKFFNGNEINKVVPVEDMVWICTTGGLFYFLRESGDILEIKQFKGIWINSFYAEKTQLWINDDMLYSIEKEKAFQSSDENWPLPGMRFLKVVNGYKIFAKNRDRIIHDSLLVVKDNNEIIGSIKKVPLNAVTLDNDKNLWFFGKGVVKFSTRERKIFDRRKTHFTGLKVKDCGNYMCFIGYGVFARFNKVSREIEKFEYDGSCKDYIVDNNCFWILFKDGIVRLKKTRNDAFFKTKSNIRKARIGTLFNEEDIIERIKKANEMILSFQKEKRSKWVNKNGYTLKCAFRTYKPKDIKRIQAFLNEEKKPLEKEVGYYILATSSLTLGYPSLSLQYYDKFRTEFPNSKFLDFITEEDIKRIKATDSTMQEIKSKNLSKDEELWELGNLFFEASKVSWNRGEVLPNTDYPFSLFDELIEKYPSSNWADNAEMKMLLYFEGGIHEGGNITLSCIDKYKSFIEKYPNSELLPVAKLEIGDHYFDFVWGSIYEHYKRMELSEIKEYVNKAKFWYEDIISNYPGNEYSEKAKSKLKEIEDFLEESSWSLQLTMKDTSFLIDDIIAIDLELQNLGKRDKTIKVRKDLPNFVVSVYSLGSNKRPKGGARVPFIKDFSIDMEEKQLINKLISAHGGSYSEKQNIQKLIFNDDGPFNAWGFGKYKLNKPGWYKIVARFKNPENHNDIISNETFFLIKQSNKISPRTELDQ